MSKEPARFASVPHVAYGITSLAPDQADAKKRLQLNRGHWTIG